MKKLIVYFSTKGNTRMAAEKLGKLTNADIYEIQPSIPYSDDDLNWRNKKSRSSIEMMDEKSRPEINKELPNTELYNKIYIGFPIWWGVAPRIINTFIENSKLKDKDIVIFATSGGSGIDYALNDLKKHYPELRIIGGKLINKNISEDII